MADDLNHPIPSNCGDAEMADSDVLIVGAGTGGTAAALAVASMGLRVILTEETDWPGGQLTSQGVPPDEHPWIEQFGCTARYRAFRNQVRGAYEHRGLSESAKRQRHLNPGGGWVSRLCFEPNVGAAVLSDQLREAGFADRPHLSCWMRTQAVAAEVEGDQVRGVMMQSLESGRQTFVRARYFLDATELGDLLPMTGTEYVVGKESSDETGEPSAPERADSENVQALTWCFALTDDPSGDHTIAKPDSYERWSTFRPPFWPGNLIGEVDLDPVTGEPRRLPFMSDSELSWFTYRQIFDPSNFANPAQGPTTLVNWPMNDYFVGSIIDVPDEVKRERLEDARQQGLCLLYWMQTELGLTRLRLDGRSLGTDDGFAKAPYIRESRRIKARFTVLEQHVSAATNPRWDRAEEFADSVGVGAYRIDLHPTTGGDSYLDLSSVPFQIPLGSLVPVRMRNLLPACKNLGVTHITNGCYRLHPVEWNIGEAAGLLAAFCVLRGIEPAQVHERTDLCADFQALLTEQGIELAWPRLHAL